MSKRLSLPGIYVVLLVLGLLFVMASLKVGPIDVSWSGMIGIVSGNGPADSTTVTAVLHLRLPRMIGAFVVGGALAVSGLALQGVFRNPLAAPGVLGVSSGGAFGAILMILLGVERTGMITAGAFLTALVTVYVVYRLATRLGRTPVATLLLAGLAVGAFYSALIGLAMSLVDPYRLNRLLFWLLGGLDGLRWPNVVGSLIPFAVGTAGLFVEMKGLDLLSQGEASARSMGLNIRAVKIRTLVWVTLLTATAVSITGVIGFVGLIIPHAVRMLIGPIHRRLFPVVFLAGGVFLIGCDVLSRWVIQPAEIRIGIITALMGVPFFLLLLRRRSLGWGSRS